MDNFNLMPQQAQPVNRITTGQLPSELAELEESALNGDSISSTSVLPSTNDDDYRYGCSYDGEDAE